MGAWGSQMPVTSMAVSLSISLNARGHHVSNSWATCTCCVCKIWWPEWSLPAKLEKVEKALLYRLVVECMMPLLSPGTALQPPSTMSFGAWLQNGPLLWDMLVQMGMSTLKHWDNSFASVQECDWALLAKAVPYEWSVEEGLPEAKTVIWLMITPMVVGGHSM